MPGFGEIQKEIRKERIPDTPYDAIRKKYLERISAKTGRNAILYYSGWLQKPVKSTSALMSINDNDKNGFMSAIRGLDVRT